MQKRGTGLDMLNAKQKITARFASQGVVVYAANASWSMTLSTYGYAGAMRAVKKATPQPAAIASSTVAAL